MDAIITGLTNSSSFSTTITILQSFKNNNQWNTEDKTRLLRFFLNTNNDQVNNCWESMTVIKLLLNSMPSRVIHDVAQIKPEVTGTEDPDDIYLPSYLNSTSVRVDYENKIASGGQATIYNGTYKGKSVAVKILDFDPHYGKLKGVKENIYKEADTIMKLPNQYCVKVYGVFVDEQKNPIRIGFVMNKYSCDLFHYIQEHKDDTWEKKKEIIVKCFECLQSIHSLSTDSVCNGVLHNDIKSENFLLNVVDGEIHELVIADFGFADIRTYQTYYNSSNSILGTVYDKQKGTEIYQAPELFEDDDVVPYTKRSDIFSLGRMVGEIITSTKPFSHIRNRNRITMACSKNAEDFKFPIDCPPLLSIVKYWCCNTNISDRPGSCGDVLELLRKCDLDGSFEEVKAVQFKIQSGTKKAKYGERKD
jgi:serine/threonine protein kinase